MMRRGAPPPQGPARRSGDPGQPGPPVRSHRRPVPPPPPAPAPAPGPPRNLPPRDNRPTQRAASPAGQRYQPPLAWSNAPDQPSRAGTRYAPTQRPEPIPAAPTRDPARRRTEPRRTDPVRSTPPPPRPPASSRGSDGASPRKPAGATAKPRRRRKMRIGRMILVMLLVLVVGSVGLVFYYDSQLHRTDALAAYAGRPADTPGTNWLIVGTDSRSDLSAEEKKELSTGDSDGSRTDTIMLVSKRPGGKAMITSIPRDLYVPIPGMGSHKINAAFNFGGPQLLVQTVEGLTGVHIDHYAEIGFGGFDQLVDAVGGVRMCLDQPLNDPKAGLNLPAGCQNLNGQQALGLVRTRAFPNADLERVVNQRKFLSALMAKATSPAVLLNPFRLIPFVNGAVNAVTVDKRDHIWNLFMLALMLRGNPITTTTPTGGDEYTDDGDALVVDDSTTQFFDHIRTGTAVPEDLLSTGGGAVG